MILTIMASLKPQKLVPTNFFVFFCLTRYTNAKKVFREGKKMERERGRKESEKEDRKEIKWD